MPTVGNRVALVIVGQDRWDEVWGRAEIPPFHLVMGGKKTTTSSITNVPSN